MNLLILSLSQHVPTLVDVSHPSGPSAEERAGPYFNIPVPQHEAAPEYSANTARQSDAINTNLMPPSMPATTVSAHSSNVSFPGIDMWRAETSHENPPAAEGEPNMGLNWDDPFVAQSGPSAPHMPK